jgi:DNA-binding MarR family transcriptional regulator
MIENDFKTGQGDDPSEVPAPEHSSEIGPVHESPGHLIRRCHQIAIGLFLDTYNKYGITSPQLSILMVVRDRPGIDQTQLSGLVALDRTNTATTLTRLEQKRLVRRESRPPDRRTRHVYITEQGEALLRNLPSEPEAVSDRLLDKLNPAERYLFVEILKKIVTSKNSWSRAPLHPKLRDRFGPPKAGGKKRAATSKAKANPRKGKR